MNNSIQLTDEQWELIEEYANCDTVSQELQARIDSDIIVSKCIELMQSAYPIGMSTKQTEGTIQQIVTLQIK